MRTPTRRQRFPMPRHRYRNPKALAEALRQELSDLDLAIAQAREALAEAKAKPSTEEVMAHRVTLVEDLSTYRRRHDHLAFQLHELDVTEEAP